MIMNDGTWNQDMEYKDRALRVDSTEIVEACGMM